MFILLLFYTNLKLSGVESYTGLNRGLESFIGIMDISPALMDINDDGKQEIFFACDDGDGDGKGKVYAYDSNWNLMWTKDIQGNIGANPCVSDLDNDGDYELIVATVSGWVYVFNTSDGVLLQGWPISLNGECYSSPACGDLDGDGIKEIVIGSSNGVYVLSPDGSIHDIEWIGWSFYAGINLVDIDKDGDLDILATPSTNDHAYIFPIWMDYEGGKLTVVQTDVKMLPERKGRAVKIPEKFRKSKSFNYYNIATPAVGDIDGDGWIDVISIETGIDGNIVHRWEYTYNHGWRVSEVWQDIHWGEIMGMYSSPVITDVDNDNMGEVIVAGNFDPGINFGYLKLKCYEPSGEIKWHKEITGYDVWPNSPYSSPALGDIDNDGKEEIVIGSDIGKLYSFNAEDGSSTDFSVKSVLAPITSSPVIADIDNDGKIDIICTSEDHFVYSWEGGNCANGRVEWGEFHRDNYNSGDYIKGAENLVCTGVNESSVSLSWDDKSDLEDGYYIYREIDGISSLIGFVQGDSFVDNDVVNGKTAKYFIQAIKGEYPSKLSNEISIYVPYCNRPTITSLTFQDSIVKITWNDNSRKNKDYYVGKKVRGRVAGTGHDTTFGYHMGHYPGDATSFIDTFPIEGENIYRVAAMDSTWTGIPQLKKGLDTQKTGYNNRDKNGR